MKVSEVQREVLMLMLDGWELGKSTTMDVNVWIQKNGIGRGGEAKNIKYNTFKSLRDKKLIREEAYKFPVTRYFITKLGEHYAKQEKI